MAESEMKIIFTVAGKNDLVEANKKLVETGHLTKHLEDGFDALGAAELRSVKASKKLAAVYKELQKALADEIITQEQFNRTFEEAIRQAEEFVLTDKKLIATAKQEKKATEEAAKAKAKEAQELENLRRKYDPLHAASERRAQSLAEINKLQKENKLSSDQAAVATNALEKEYKEFETAVKGGGIVNAANQFARFGGSAYAAQQRVKRFASVGLQQAGYQVGDFIVQVQSGQNALVALGQQGSQLAGIFGAKGAIIGAGIALATAIAMIAINAYKARNGIESFQEALEDIDNAASAASSAFSIANEPLEDLEDRFGSLAPAIAAANAQLSRIRTDQAIAELDGLAGAFERSLDPTSMQRYLFPQANLLFQSAFGMNGLNWEDIFLPMKEAFQKLNFNKLGLDIGRDTYEGIAQGIREASGSGDLEAAILEIQDVLVMLEEASANASEEQRERIEQLSQTYEGLLNLVEARLEVELRQLQLQEEITKSIQESTDEIEQEIALQEKILQFGKESAEVQALKEEQIEANIRAQYREMAGTAGLTGEQEESLQTLIDQTLAHMRNEQAIEDQEEAAKELERAFEAVTKVIESIGGANQKLETTIAGQIAELEALRAGDTDAGAAGQLAVALAEAELERREAINDILSETALSEADRLAYIAEANALYGVQVGLINESAALARQIAEEELRVREELRLAKEAEREAERAAEKRRETQEKLDNLREELRLREELLRTGSREARQALELHRAKQEYGEMAVLMTDEEIMALERRFKVVEEGEKRAADLRQTAEKAIEENIMAIVTGTKSAAEAFKAMAAQIISETFRIIVVRQMAANIAAALGFANGGAFMGGRVLPNKYGNAFAGGNVVPFARGGVVASPTFFPMSGGRTGLMGEAGPEAIMPLKRGKDGRLGVQAEGSSDVNVTQIFNISGNGDQYIMEKVMSAAPMIAESAKSQIINDRLRGGTYKKAFR